MADQPDISPDLDVPLPQVPADSALVPYRTARRLPGQQPVVTTGYGARAQPLMSPSPGTQGVPDLSRMMRRAFEQLPVDQAIKATNAAQQFMGHRMFSQAVQKGVPIQDAWRDYGRMMFAGQNMGASGFAPPPTPVNYPGMGIAYGNTFHPSPRPAAPAKPTTHYNSSTGEVLQVNPDGTVNVLRAGKAKPAAPTETVSETYQVPAKPALGAQGAWKGVFGIGARPARAASPAEPAKTIRKTKKVGADTADTEEEETTPPESPVAPTVAAPTVAKRVRVTGPGRQKGTIPEGAKLPEGWKLE